MDSHQFRHGFSKSQFCLHKILQIIASYPSKEEEFSPIPQVIEFEEKKGLAFDLNMELFPWPEESESFTASSTTAAVAGSKAFSHDSADGEFRPDFAVEKSSSEGECDPNAIQAIERGSEKSEVGIQQSVEEKVNEERGIKAAAMIEDEEEGKRKSDCFSLLIEAAEMVSCDSNGKEEIPPSQLENEAPPPAVEEVLPVVRSKRGRSQVLPSRYRDSVIEPRKRQPPRPTVSSKRGKFNK